ncbi:MAG: carboxypeptidase-like regulatory domain-containing protein, partial [Bacteroidota bacterium]|nr:carboxypeptidase-like regulatory domain-containing protein [Bacteroidota bacterium]
MNKFIISLTIFLLFVTNIVIAQESCLLGTVIDKKTKETLIGANIFVTKNPIQGTVTNLDGEFKLALDSGVYNISVSYISYKTKTFSDIEISSNSKKELLIELDGVNLGIDAVVVTAKARQKTENALQILQKLSPKVVDGISTEQIGKLNDSNAAQALK